MAGSLLTRMVNGLSGVKNPWPGVAVRIVMQARAQYPAGA
jgi:hypothetical protein